MNNCSRVKSENGSVVLVALCFVAVLGIALASYLAVSNQAMKLSHRSYLVGVSEQTAESGLERALVALNTNDWTGWTINSASHRAYLLVTSDTKYGSSGITALYRLRVDNYDLNTRSSTWSASTTYSVNDLVGYNGTWYRCVTEPCIGQTPANLGTGTLKFWVPEPIPWAWRANSDYRLNDVVNHGGIWYRCTMPPANTATWSPSTYWTVISSIKPFNASDSHITGDIVYQPDATTWYLCTASGTPGTLSPTAQISWQYSNSAVYNFNDVICTYSSLSGEYVWYRYINPTPGTASAPPNSNWTNVLSDSWPWLSTETYHLNDVVNYGGNWYRALREHINQPPPNTTYWADGPAISTAWDLGKFYNPGDVVNYGSNWYLYVGSTASKGRFLSETLYWAAANGTSSLMWNSTASYAIGSVVNYGGVWYRASAANSNTSPNDAAAWSAINAPVIYAEGEIGGPDINSIPIKTQLRATVSPAVLFPNAAGTTSSLSFNSNATSGIIDSYNSDLGAYNENVLPPFSPANPNNGFSATLAAMDGTLTVNGGNIQGYLSAPSSSSPPYAPLFSTGTGVNLKGTTSATGIDFLRTNRSPYVPQFDPQSVPKATQLTVSSSGTVTIGTPGGTTPIVYFVAGGFPSGLYLNGGQINIIGPVRLDIQGQLRLRNGGKINIASTGSAEIHFSGRLRIDELSGIVNLTKDPKKLTLIGTSSAGNHTYSCTLPFYGAIYIPHSSTGTSLTFSNVSGDPIIYGAVSAKTIIFNSAAAFHYDVSLQSKSTPGVDSPFIITEWRELTDPAEKVTLPVP